MIVKDLSADYLAVLWFSVILGLVLVRTSLSEKDFGTKFCGLCLFWFHVYNITRFFANCKLFFNYLLKELLAFVPNTMVLFHGLEANTLLELGHFDLEKDLFPFLEIVLKFGDLLRVGSVCEVTIDLIDTEFDLE